MILQELKIQILDFNSKFSNFINLIKEMTKLFIVNSL